jgi:hypothetical protein
VELNARESCAAAAYRVRMSTTELEMICRCVANCPVRVCCIGI